jgi:hypothetical protein
MYNRAQVETWLRDLGPGDIELYANGALSRSWKCASNVASVVAIANAIDSYISADLCDSTLYRLDHKRGPITVSLAFSGSDWADHGPIPTVTPDKDLELELELLRIKERDKLLDLTKILLDAGRAAFALWASNGRR